MFDVKVGNGDYYVLNITGSDSTKATDKVVQNAEKVYALLPTTERTEDNVDQAVSNDNDTWNDCYADITQSLQLNGSTYTN